MSIGEHTADRVELAAPAKLNLALLVGPVRTDGFHEIASLMLPVTLADHVTVEKTPGAGLDVVCDVAPGDDNLAAKMVRELEARLDRTFEVRVTIDKRVPAGGGLGGGSSDAAATLLALERLFDLDLSLRLRYEAALAVGSDVPFFLWPGPQIAMGRGQVLKGVELPALHLVIAVPDLGLSTAAVYKWRDEDAEVTREDFVPRAQAARESRRGGAHGQGRRRARGQRPGAERGQAQAEGRRADRAPARRRRPGGGHDRQRRRRVRRVRLAGEGDEGAGGRRPRPRLVRHRPPARPGGPPQGARRGLACYAFVPPRRASARLAAPLPFLAGA